MKLLNEDIDPVNYQVYQLVRYQVGFHAHNRVWEQVKIPITNLITYRVEICVQIYENINQLYHSGS